ncbi:hypothetical protein Maes01_00446 [Microbulbifer aestuariivivens]|uniref:BLUF domain-containing protein n=1 Tax=Microbulbifer aestuariivivens TaxID=1908308 RepID=A0ABP9WL15_9GAMM
MGELVRLVYASKASFMPMPASSGVEPTVARILMQSRQNNSRKDVGGVLYFGDGFFFQALEGDRGTVTETFERISADSRHQQVTTLSMKTVTTRLFADWSMKYVPAEKSLREFLGRRGYTRFQPLRFSEEEAEALVHFFDAKRDEDVDGGKKPGRFSLRALFSRKSRPAN